MFPIALPMKTSPVSPLASFLHRRSVAALGTALALVVTACGPNNASPGSDDSLANGTAVGSETSITEASETPFIVATLGEPIAGFQDPVDIAIRPTSESSSAPQNFVVEQGGLIREMSADGRPGRTMADLTALTKARGERGLLGLAFDQAGTRAFVNYTDLEGNTSVDQFDVDENGIFLNDSRRTLFSVIQPYRNHNGGELLVTPDGQSLLIFTGDGGSANDPERYALDPDSDLGKIIQIDISSTDTAPRVLASGLRNPWRAAFDSASGNLWIADVGEHMWEEVNVIDLDVISRSQGVSFGWSAFEGTAPVNVDQREIHESLTTVDPVYTYPHENEDCSISGGYVYRGTEIPHLGTWYFFADLCSGDVRALCVTEVDGATKPCGVESLGTVAYPVGILPDSFGRPWVLSLNGSIVPIISAN